MVHGTSLLNAQYLERLEHRHIEGERGRGAGEEKKRRGKEKKKKEKRRENRRGGGVGGVGGGGGGVGEKFPSIIFHRQDILPTF